jgi:predicted nucleotidyltransferase component of viral defense system
MLDQYNLENLTKELKIAPLNIVRESVELEILNAIAQSELVKKIVFYGGTALRLAFGSPRFSEDLDFLMIKKIRRKEFKDVLSNLTKETREISLKDFKDKKNTLFALINVRYQTFKHPLNIKIEITKRKNGVKFEFIPLSSPCSHLKPIIPTITIESLKKLKEIAIKKRNEPRDWFDLWFITKYLKEPWKPPKKFPFNKKEFKRELKRFLPQDKWTLIDQIAL